MPAENSVADHMRPLVVCMVLVLLVLRIRNEQNVFVSVRQEVLDDLLEVVVQVLVPLLSLSPQAVLTIAEDFEGVNGESQQAGVGVLLLQLFLQLLQEELLDCAHVLSLEIAGTMFWFE